jgi:hypothetical protein
MMAHLSFWMIAVSYCFVTFMVAVLAWSRGYNIGKSEGFRRGYKTGRAVHGPVNKSLVNYGN